MVFDLTKATPAAPPPDPLSSRRRRPAAAPRRAAARATDRFERKREAILNAATRILNRKGIKGLTLGDTAAAVELSTTSVTYYFKRKDDLAAVLKQLDKTSGDTSFEERECVGLDNNPDQLVGTFRVKRPNGFSGGPCTAGSTEFVAYWADFGDSCTYSYLGTVQVNGLGMAVRFLNLKVGQSLLVYSKLLASGTVNPYSNDVAFHVK